MRPPDDSLTPAERAAFAALPRDAAVSDLEEQRTVQALRARGLLGAPRGRARAWQRPALRITAAATLFLGGVLVGRRLGPPRQRPGTAALEIQRTGSSFVQALSLMSTAPARDPTEQATVREVARRVLETGQTLLDRTGRHDGQGKETIVWF